MPTTEGTAQPNIDWRDWVAFLGYVLATAVVVSVVLASVVLVISMQAEGPTVASQAPAENRTLEETRKALPAEPPAAATLPMPAKARAEAGQPAVSAGSRVEPARVEPARLEPAPAQAPRIEVTAESLRADKPIVAQQPAASLPEPAAKAAAAVGDSTAAQASLPEAAAGAAQRIEITSESLRAEKPIVPTQAEPSAPTPAAMQPAADAGQAPAAEPPAVGAQQPAAANQPATAIGSAQ